MERKIINIRLLRWGFQAFLEKSRILILRTKPEGFQTFMAQLVWEIDDPLKSLVTRAVVLCVDPCSAFRNFPTHDFCDTTAGCHECGIINQSAFLIIFVDLTPRCTLQHQLCCAWWFTKRLSKNSYWLPQDKLLLSLWNDSLNYPLSKFLGVCLYIYILNLLS